MKTVTLRFNSIEHLGSFVRSLDGGYYINTPRLCVKGTFPCDAIEQACNTFGAQIQETQHIEGYGQLQANS